MNVYVNDPKEPAKACVIWLHGLGADSQDMAGLALQLGLETPVRHVFIDAPVRPVTLNNSMPMRAWYDILGLKLTDREDQEGVLQSAGIIREAIASQLTEGFSSQEIFLAGFSQGGAMALFTGLSSIKPLAGIIALSAYLPLISSLKLIAEKKLPIFVGSGQNDTLVLPEWTEQSVTYLETNGYQNIERHTYPMEHSICLEEMQDIAKWLTKRVASIRKSDRGAK